MAFYTFRQNNSGGSFHFSKRDGISTNVIIEASSLDEASGRAEGIGIYFNGVDDGRDCECCGDRWYEPWQDDGFAEPGLYESGKLHPDNPWYWNEPDTYIHYLDGRVEGVANLGE